jgi:hypothetical protein
MHPVAQQRLTASVGQVFLRRRGRVNSCVLCTRLGNRLFFDYLHPTLYLVHQGLHIRTKLTD